ncbi:unnamed protein product [Zymoseptoria tritici ST99CH_1E4]|uniref:Uncharacterized protein n=1 Tax=Zymoseptoria tritici ST99CH_1E4 TaxID=1276532 RepID=A0A2H1GQ11_ZYMTR|nr:unnamed protein product [Zymoseptoria tritici ST99CH_1E4]
MASFLEILGWEIAQMLRIYLFIMEIILLPVKNIAQGLGDITDEDVGSAPTTNNNDDSNDLAVPSTKDGTIDEDTVLLPPQSAASIEFFATPELCERSLLLLPLLDKLHARQASLALRDTIHASPSLQRGLFLQPGQILHDPTDLLIFNPILILHPFVFAARVGMLRGMHKLFLTPFLLNYIETYKTATLGTIGDMFITQPPQTILQVEYTWTKPCFGEDQTVVEKRLFMDREGIKVKDLMRFIVEMKWGRPDAQLYQEWDHAEGEVAVVVRGAWEISRERI